MNYITIKTKIEHEVGWITFNRPEIRNAFDASVITELSNAFAEMEKNSTVRVVVLAGEGKSFCAGADLNWMGSAITQSFEENLAEANALANLFYQIYALRYPVVARVNGAAIGGGTGFVAVCDLALAAESAMFSFSEVKIGVVPACIGPYVVKKLGEGRARELFITGERMNAMRAREVGLVHKVVPDSQLDSEISSLVSALLSSGPEAIATAKRLVSNVGNMSPEEFKPWTAEMIAKLRISPEGQEGMDAFLNKRQPKWAKKKS